VKELRSNNYDKWMNIRLLARQVVIVCYAAEQSTKETVEADAKKVERALVRTCDIQLT